MKILQFLKLFTCLSSRCPSLRRRSCRYLSSSCPSQGWSSRWSSYIYLTSKCPSSTFLSTRSSSYRLYRPQGFCSPGVGSLDFFPPGVRPPYVYPPCDFLPDGVRPSGVSPPGVHLLDLYPAGILQIVFVHQVFFRSTSSRCLPSDTVRHRSACSLGVLQLYNPTRVLFQESSPGVFR